MFRNLLLTVVTCLAFSATAAAQQVLTPEGAIPDQYIVVFDEVQTARTQVTAQAQALARQHGGRILHVYEGSVRGFAASMSATAAAAIARNPRVRYVEQDSVMTIVASQPNATWGLDRVDQRNLPLNSTYTYDTNAVNVDVYIIDTGIRGAHVEFGGRVSSGFTAIADGNGTNDCNGHGTHVAGTVGGSIYGVAKSVELHPVRVLGCNGSGSTSGVIAGVNWVATNHSTTPAVANMSLGGGASTALDDAVRSAIASGVTFAIAAGNSNANACNSSPARVAEALTVGSTTSTDARSSFSNFGTCVDLFAPGSSITSAWNSSNTATNTISGTSMATPHVAGVAALYLAVNSSASPGAVHAAVVNNATPNKVTGAGFGSPNRLLYSLFSAAPPTDLPPAAAFTFTCSGLTCTFNGSGSTDDLGITSYSWNFGDGQTGSGAVVSHAYTASGTFTAVLTVTDTASQTDTESKSVVVSSGGAPCTNCTEYTGSLSGTGASQIQPNGTYYFSSVSGTHRGWLQGPANADFDLYLQKWNGFFWQTVAVSESVTSTEQIAYTGTLGYYRWRVYSYSGSGTYTFWLQRP